MGNTNNDKSGSNAGLMAVLLAVLGFILLMCASGMKEEYKYYWDEDYRNGTDFMNICGWIGLISAVFSGFLAMGGSGKEKKQEIAKRESEKRREMNTYAEGVYYMDQPATMENLQAAYLCFIKIPEYLDSEWKAKKCRLMLEAMEEEKERLAKEKQSKQGT